MKQSLKISVKLHPNSSKEEVKEILEDNFFEIWVKEPAEKGKANQQLLKILKKHLKDNKSYDINEIKIKRGFSSRNKTIEIKWIWKN